MVSETNVNHLSLLSNKVLSCLVMCECDIPSSVRLVYILTTNLAACVSVCVSVQNLTNFCPHALISTPNVPKILFA